MTKEVMVSIKGLQFDQSADSEEIETIQWGQYYKKNMTNYLTPYGGILIGLDTSKVSFTESEKEIRVNVDYALEVNYEYLADCKIEMYIRPKDNGGIDLLS